MRLEDLFEKNDMKMETWDLKVAKSSGKIPWNKPDAAPFRFAPRRIGFATAENEPVKFWRKRPPPAPPTKKKANFAGNGTNPFWEGYRPVLLLVLGRVKAGLPEEPIP